MFCKNCGHPQSEHDPNLVNTDPDDPEYALVDKVKKGYKMDVLQCMETRWSSEYQERVKDLYWGDDRWYGMGYVSPNPEAEAADYKNRRYTGMQSSVMIVYQPGKGSYIIQLE